MFNYRYPDRLSCELVSFLSLYVSEERAVLDNLYNVKIQRERTGLRLHMKVCLGGVR